MKQRRYLRSFLEYIIALGVAVLTYLFFTLNENIDESNFVIPLVAEFNDNFVSLENISPTVQVTVKGNPSSLNRIVEKNMQAIVDFSGVTQAGNIHAPVVLQRSGSFAQIDNVEVTVSPQEVMTSFDKKISKNLQVRPALINSLPRGYTFERSQVLPQFVRVFGPSSILDAIDFISTSNIDLSSVTEDISINVTLQSPSVLIEATDITNVKVNIAVRESIVVRVFKGVFPQIRNLSSDLVISRQLVPAVVTVQGSLLFLDRYSPTAFIDCYRFRTPGVYEIEIQISDVEGVEVVSLDPNPLFIELRARAQQYPVPSLDPRISRQSNEAPDNN